MRHRWGDSDCQQKLNYEKLPLRQNFVLSEELTTVEAWAEDFKLLLNCI